MPNISEQLEQLSRVILDMEETIAVINGTSGWRSLYTTEEIQEIEFEVARVEKMLNKVKQRIAFLVVYYRSMTIGSDSKFPIHRQRLRGQIYYIKPYVEIVASKTIGRSGETIADL